MLLDIIIIVITTYTTWYASEILSKGTEAIGKRYNIDGEMTEELICGKCGGPSRMVKVPKMMVELEEQLSEIEGV
mgnify:CR=1 FL=1